MQNATVKKRETICIVFLVIVLMLIIAISKIALGVNFTLMSNPNPSTGFQEIRKPGIWTFSFDSFSGEQVVSLEVIDQQHQDSLILQSGLTDGTLTITISDGEKSVIYHAPTGLERVDLAGFDRDKLFMTATGEDALNGYFSAQWR